MEQVKWVSLLIIGVTVISGVVMAYFDKHTQVKNKKSVHRISRENSEE